MCVWECQCKCVYPVCVRVCACDMAAAYSHFKMASIFLSQQNGDCKIVVLAVRSLSFHPSLSLPLCSTVAPTVAVTVTQAKVDTVYFVATFI